MPDELAFRVIHYTNHCLSAAVFYTNMAEKGKGLLGGISWKKPPTVFCLRTRECRTLTKGDLLTSYFCSFKQHRISRSKSLSYCSSRSDIQEYIWWILSNKAEGRLLGIDEGPHSLTEPSKEITSVGSGESSHIYAYKS